MAAGGILAYALAPAGATVVGAALAAIRPPSPTVRGGAQHVAGELLPEAMRIHEPFRLAIGFAVGIALMLVVRALTDGSKAGSDRAGGRGMAAAVGIDLLIDGILVGIGFAAGAETGILIVAALALETFFLGVATAAELAQAQAAPSRVIGIPAVLALVLLAGAAVGAFALQGLADDWLEILLGFGAAALLYLVTEELLVEAHEVPETPVTTALFFVGFLALLLIEMAT